MKYKHIFLVWLLADAFLVMAVFFFIFIYKVSMEGNLLKTAFTFCGIGFLLSLPSLLLLLIAYPYLNEKAEQHKDAYVIAIIAINFLYLIASVFFFGFSNSGWHFLFFTGTTIAGLLSLFIVKKYVEPETVVDSN